MPAVILSPIFQVNIYLTDFIIRPPVYGSNGRTYKMLVMFFFLFLTRHRCSEPPRPIAVKLGHMIGNWLNFIMQVQKFGERSPTKNLGAKTCKISVDFIKPTSDFDREYLRNGSRYPKSESYVIKNNSSRVLRKKVR